LTSIPVLTNCSIEPKARQPNSFASASARAGFSSTMAASSIEFSSRASW
jgi:hypothetical protein